MPNQFSSLGTTLSSSLHGVWGGVLDNVPKLIIAFLIFVIGWIVGIILDKVVMQIMAVLKIDKALKSAGVEELLAKGGMKLNSGAFVGALVKWFVIVVFLVASFNVLNLTQVNDFLQSFVLLYIPKVIVAVLVLIAAAILGKFVSDLVSKSSATMGIKTHAFLGAFAKWAIWIFAVIIALSSLDIGQQVFQALIGGFVTAVSIALGLAFGLGGQDTAKRVLDRLEKDVQGK